MYDKLLAFVSGSALASVVCVALAGPDQAAPQVVDESASRAMVRAAEGVEALARAIESCGLGSTRLVPASADGPGRSERVETVDASGVAELRTRLAAFERKLARIGSRVDGPAVAALAGGEFQATRVDEVRKLSLAFRSSDTNVGRAARHELMLRTPEQILAKLGMPSSCGVSQTGNMCWYYYEGRNHSISITFIDGLAIL